MSSPASRSYRPYIFYGQTTSLCEKCLKLVPAKIRIEGDDVFYEKRCPEHGVRLAHVSSDAKFFRWQRDFLKPGDLPLHFQSRIQHGCPYDCGLCPDHEQHSCLAIVEISEACDLACPICYADSSPRKTLHRPLATVERMFDALVASEGQPDVVQLSGGEPTLHPDFFEILRLAKAKPIRHLMINTNGVRLARDPDFCARLAEHRVGTEIYLQFDSLRPDALKKIRGADLTRIRRQALENLERHNLSTTLVCVVEKGVNLDECSEIVDFALNWRCVRGVTFQPVQDAGRADDFAPENRALLTDIRRDIVSKNRIFGERDLIPLPCNPGSICIGYALRNGFDAQPVTSLFSHDDLLESVPNAITFEKYPELQKRLFELFSLSTGPDVMVERLSALLCCLPEVPVPSGLSYENVFRVNIIEFLDARNFCLGNVKRSCIHFVTEEGKIVPFDTYNLFYRNGRIAEMRKGLATRP